MKNLYLAFIVLTTSNALSQDFDKVYFDAKWRITSKQNSSFYRISSFNATLRAYDGKVTDYFAEGSEEMSGHYKNGLKEGEFLFLYSNGKLRLRASYLNNERDGIWTEYQENGMIKARCEYVGNQELLLALNDSIGKSIIEKNHFTLFTNFIEVPIFDDKGKTIEQKDVFKMEGHIENQIREGVWVIKRNNSKFATLTYDKGNLLKGTIILTRPSGVTESVLMKDQFVFPVISDPEKFPITETFRILPGVAIKNNYVLDGLNMHKLSSMEKVTLKSEDEVKAYIDEHLDLRSQVKAKTVRIIISTELGKIKDVSTDPTIPSSAMKDLKLILNSIDKLDFSSDKILIVNYEVFQEDQIK